MRKIMLAIALAATLAVAVAPARAEASCGEGCQNAKIAKLTKQVNRLSSIVGCLRAVGVSQYYGYDYYSAGYTTALDGDNSSTPNVAMVITRCAGRSAGRSALGDGALELVTPFAAHQQP